MWEDMVAGHYLKITWVKSWMGTGRVSLPHAAAGWGWGELLILFPLLWHFCGKMPPAVPAVSLTFIRNPSSW